MNSSTAPTPGFSVPPCAPAAARTVFKLLQQVRHGTLTLHLPDGSVQRFGQTDGHHHGDGHIAASMVLKNWNVCSAVLKSGDIGLAESFIAGDWTSPHLVALLRLFVHNRRELDNVVYGSWAGRVLYRVRHLLNRNSRSTARKNIHAHYDLGNAFYSLWLDDTMNYSSAWFDKQMVQPLQDAQHAKVRRALRMAGVQRGDRVLEIGCGWGALVDMAVNEFGASVTGVTLSTEQLAFAQQRMAAPSSAAQVAPQAAPKVDLRLQDYRDVRDGPYDAICSIEMVEAVGREYWPTYFAQVHALLKPGGRACIQSIVIDDALWDRYIASTDFIQQYIFPGGCLPCPREFRRAAQAAGLEVVDELAFGQDYAETLRIWRERFLAQRAQVLQLGFDDQFMHIWEFYLAYCEAAFAQGNTDLVQYTLRRPL